jgi:diacylglycerol kinase family enzyme
MGGAGFDAEIFRQTSLEWKRRTGWIAYLPPAVQAFRYGSSDIEATVDGYISRHRSPLVLIANGGSFITPKLLLGPGISYDDGVLDVLIFTCTTGPEILSTLASVGAGRIEQSPFVRRLRGQRVRIDSDPPVWVELDGDPIGRTPQEFSLVPAGLSIVTPQGEAG